MAGAGGLTERQRWRALRSQRGRESSPPRFSQSQEPSRSVSVRDRSAPFFHLSRLFPGPTRLPQGHQALPPCSSSQQLGSPRSRTRGSPGAARRPAVKRLTSPGSVSAASWRCPVGCLRLDVLHLEAGSTVAVVLAVANAVGSYGGPGLRPFVASWTVESSPEQPRDPISLSPLLWDRKVVCACRLRLQCFL